jgi:hypothetical protein
LRCTAEEDILSIGQGKMPITKRYQDMKVPVLVKILFALIVYRLGYVVTGAVFMLAAKWKKGLSVSKDIDKITRVGGIIAAGLIVLVMIFAPKYWVPIALTELTILGIVFSFLTITLEIKYKHVFLTAEEFAVYSQLGQYNQWKFCHLYRETLNNIINSSLNIGAYQEGHLGVTAEQFRFEAVKLISNLSRRWEDWSPRLDEKANHLLGNLGNIAQKVDDSQLFTVICQDIVPSFGLETALALIDANKVSDSQLFTAICQDIMPIFGLETTLALIDANKVSDSQQISMIRQDIVPTMGQKVTSSLLMATKDFQEFESCFLRVKATLKWWKFHYQDVFREIQNTSEVDQILTFLEALTNDPRMAGFISQASQSNFVHLARNEVRQTCLRLRWKKTSEYNMIVDNLIGRIKENMVHMYLGIAWKSIGNIRWQFDKFTEYVAYEMRTRDWTIDNEKNRSRWNWRDGQKLEYDQYQNALKPRLCQIVKELNLSDIELLFSLLPIYFSIQKFTKIVDVPVEWEKDVEVWESYHKGVFYEEEMEVARPKGFIKHTFVFERPYLQNAIDFLNDMDKIREAIQEHKNPRY